jgi:hypothetical protein
MKFLMPEPGTEPSAGAGNEPPAGGGNAGGVQPPASGAEPENKTLPPNAGGSDAGGAAGGSPAGRKSFLDTGAAENAGWEFMPEKFVVKSDAGKLDEVASAKKLVESYSALEKRMGSGDLPPKSADDYDLSHVENLPEKWEDMKKDADIKQFLDGAQKLGMTEKQVEFVAQNFFDATKGGLIASSWNRDIQVCANTLTELWGEVDPLTGAKAPGKLYEENKQSAIRALKIYVGDNDEMRRLDMKFGSDPDFVVLMSKIGKFTKEDTPRAGLSAIGAADLKVKESALLKTLSETAPDSPEHIKALAERDALWQRMAGLSS